MTKKKKVCIAIVDSGGRGAILAESYAKHPDVDMILAFPGNDFMQLLCNKPVICFPKIGLADVELIVKECKKYQAIVVDVCQDNAVAAGVVNALRNEGIATIGHTKEAGIIEWDKAWCRLFLQKIGLNKFQPKFEIFTSENAGTAFLKGQPNQRWFVKAAGLAAGKGALAATNNNDAIQKIHELYARFPEASGKYLVEEWLKNDDGTPGEEFSYYVLCKGKEWKFEGNYQDHKNVNDFDEGDNTGGMGSISPTMVLTQPIVKEIKYILDKVITGMMHEKDENGNSRELSGDLYLGGIIINRKGVFQVKVLEFNARLGDPEAHTVLGVTTNRYDIAMAMIGRTNFPKFKINIDPSIRMILTGAAKGYPNDYSQVLGNEIFGLADVMKNRKVKVYGSGIKKIGQKFLVSGGRVFYLFVKGKNLIDVRKKIYEEMSQVYVEGNNLHYRKDIGHSELEKYWKNKA